MESNPQLELAFNFLEYTGVNVFLTKGGNGKDHVSEELERAFPEADDRGGSDGCGGD